MVTTPILPHLIPLLPPSTQTASTHLRNALSLHPMPIHMSTVMPTAALSTIPPSIPFRRLPSLVRVRAQGVNHPGLIPDAIP